MWMRADTDVPLNVEAAPADVPERPKDRGNLLVLNLSWSAGVGLPLTGHVRYERFDPGGYYDPGAKVAHFLRFEISTSL
jgi:hypothetical protein